jgi:tRNA A-37 threonylcarbamoyl transferase component Bud32
LLPEETRNRHSGFRVDLSDEDIAALMQTLVSGSRRVQRLELSSGVVWIKQQGTETPSWWISLQRFFSRLLPYAFLRPSPILKPAAMMQRELNRLRLFSKMGFAVPQVIYASDTAMVLADVGPTISAKLKGLKRTAPDAHDAMLIKCAAALGGLHAAGLCHGRPHVRDFFECHGEVGFMDFEEEPQAVMPLATAQARDVWLLFLLVTTKAVSKEKTCDEAYRAWASCAPAAAIQELSCLTSVLGVFLPLARLIGRLHMGSDLRRFIMATDYLKNAPQPDAVTNDAGKAGNDD